MKNTKISMILNFVIAFLVLLSVTWMYTGFSFHEEEILFTAHSYNSLIFFTIESNILMGIICLYAGIEDLLILKGKKESKSNLCLILKLTGTLAITLTMTVTVFYLVPMSFPEYGLMVCFRDSNFLNHLINPLLSIICFTLFEKTKKIKFIHNITSLIPVFLYATVYTTLCIIHSSNGVVDDIYDWYKFFGLGLKSGLIIIPIFFLLNFGLSCLLWILNRIKAVE